MRFQSIAAVSALALLLGACDATQVEVKNANTIKDEPAPGLDLEVHIPYETFTLDNGLRVVVTEDRKAPIVAVGVWYHVGSKDEPEGKSGFAHLFEHLMFNGSENYDDEYFKPFEAVGVTAQNGTTWFDRTNYFQNVPTPALEMALFMESDRMGHLLGAVTEQKLENQIGVVQNEKRQGDNAPFGLVQYRQLEGLYPPGHPYRHSTIGSLEDLRGASMDDVKGWFKQYYGAANTVLVLAGDIDAETARPMVEKYFADIKAGPSLKAHKAWVPTREHDTVEVMYDNVPNARIYYNWAVAPRTQQDSHVLRLAAAALGSGKNSRLYQKLVYEEQIAQNVNVSVQRFELASNFEIQVDLKPGADVEKAKAMVDEVLGAFLAEGPAADEISRAKVGIVAARVRQLEQIGGFGGKATALAEGWLYGDDPGFYAKELGWINSASTGDVYRTAKKWLTKGAYKLTVFPRPPYQTAEAGYDRSQGLPAVGDLPSLNFPTIEEGELENGMKVVVAKRSTVPVVQMTLSLDGGFAADQGRPLGTSGFTLAMMDEGTTSRSALEIAAELESLGANLSTGSGLDTNSINLNALKPNLVDSLALYADVVRNPAFAAEEVERFRARRLAGIAQEKAQPVQLALRTLPPILYGEGHSYAAPYTGSGTVESVTSITRDDLVQYHTDIVRPDNATLFVVGDITLEEALAALQPTFGDWTAPSTPVPAKNIADVAVADGQGRVIIMDKPNSPQSLILAGHLLPSTGAEDALALGTANDILGGQFTARVNMNLREDKGWAYGAYTIALNARGQRPWIVYAPVQTDKTSESLTELQREITEYLADNPASADELTRSIAGATNSLPGQFETAGAVLGSMVSSHTFGRPYNYAAGTTERYAGLELAEVQAAARAHIKPGALVWLIVGDRAKIEEGVRALGLGPVEVWDLDGNKLD